MIELDEKKIEAFLDKAAEDKTPEQVDKIDRQFAEKLARLEETNHLPDDVLAKLREMWKMLRDPEAALAWKDKALVMTALSYFIAPFDLVPDMAGKHGYRDDALVVRIVHRRLHRDRDAD